MKIDCTTIMKQADGSKAMATQELPLTLGIVCSTCLNLQAEQGADPKEVAGDGLLAIQLYSAKTIELSAKQCVRIQERLAKVWLPIIVSQAYHLLEGKGV